MPRAAQQGLTDPPTPPTDIRAAHLRETRRWILEEFSDRAEAWLVIDDQHVWNLEDLE